MRSPASLANLVAPWTSETARQANAIRWSTYQPKIPENHSPIEDSAIADSPLTRINRLLSSTKDANRITKLVAARERLVKQLRQQPQSTKPQRRKLQALGLTKPPAT